MLLCFCTFGDCALIDSKLSKLVDICAIAQSKCLYCTFNTSFKSWKSVPINMQVWNQNSVTKSWRSINWLRTTDGWEPLIDLDELKIIENTFKVFRSGFGPTNQVFEFRLKIERQFLERHLTFRRFVNLTFWRWWWRHARVGQYVCDASCLKLELKYRIFWVVLYCQICLM